MKHKLSELKLPLILIAEMILCLFFGDILSIQVKSILYAVSLAIKGAFMMVLPFIIFTFLVNSMIELNHGSISNGVGNNKPLFLKIIEAFLFPLLMLSMVCFSNFTSTTLAGFLGFLSLNSSHSFDVIASAPNQLSPFWSFDFPKLISNEKALIAGLISGLFLSFLSLYWKLETPRKWIKASQGISLAFLKKGFIPLIPIFILGFILKIQHDGIMDIIFKQYLSLIGFIGVFAFAYILFLYGVATNFKGTPWLASLRTMLPAMLTGFSTMSSASALPLIIHAAEKNTESSLVRGVVPFTVNIHLIGDCFAISILALGIMTSFGMELPSLQNYLIFTCFFVLAKFAVAAVPGGGIFVMLPILEKYLGFSGEMLSLITALYILFDPFITSANVMGNGAFSMIFVRIYKRLGLKDTAPQAVKSRY